LNIAQVLIRKAIAADAESVLRVHYAAVHETASETYEQWILDEWSPPVTPKRIRELNDKFARKLDGELMFVAVDKDEVLAFGSIVPEECELRAVYVSPRAGRIGVGAKLLAHLEEVARSLKVPRLRMDASLNAEHFYLRHGYFIEQRGDHFLKSGRRMDCVYMCKEL
jgi:Acetyltransferase (GNAT) family.